MATFGRDGIAARKLGGGEIRVLCAAKCGSICLRQFSPFFLLVGGKLEFQLLTMPSETQKSDHPTRMVNSTVPVACLD